MGFFGILAKNLATSTVKTGFNVVKATGNIINEQIEKSQLENLMHVKEEFDENISHYSKEDQEFIRDLANQKAMEQIAEDQAMKRNRYSYLASKYPNLNKKLLTDKS